MSRRTGALTAGLGTLALAWPLGSLPLAVGGLGAVIAALFAWAWERRLRGRLAIRRDRRPGALVEGDDLQYEITLGGAHLPGTFVLDERLGRLPTRAIALRRSGPTQVVIPNVPRGRLQFAQTVLTADDPLGLTRLTTDIAVGESILVRPSVPRLRSLFTEGGTRFGAGRRGAVAGPTGLDLRGVREYREGEPLRAVHWVSTARRGRLMVRELEEPPRHDATVLLDLDQAAETGPPGRTSLDEAVRVAGALVLAQLERGRTVRLIIAGDRRQAVVARSLPDWEGVLDVLAAAEPRVGGDPHSRSAGEGGALGRTILVTAREDTAATSPAELAAIVLVDAPTYAGRAGSRVAPGLLGLAARGVPIAVVRCGDDLRAALEGALTARGTAVSA